MVHQEVFTFSTKGYGDMHDLTDRVSKVVHNSGIKLGMVNVFNIGSRTWQQIFHIDCDVKPRQRQVMVTVYGE